MERFFENAMYASRWLLAPVYFGLSLALVALTIKFFQEIFHVLPNIFSVAEADLGNDSNLLIVFYVQIMPDDFVMQLHRF